MPATGEDILGWIRSYSPNWRQSYYFPKKSYIKTMDFTSTKNVIKADRRPTAGDRPQKNTPAGTRQIVPRSSKIAQGATNQRVKKSASISSPKPGTASSGAIVPGKSTPEGSQIVPRSSKIAQHAKNRRAINLRQFARPLRSSRGPICCFGGRFADGSGSAQLRTESGQSRGALPGAERSGAEGRAPRL